MYAPATHTITHAYLSWGLTREISILGGEGGGVYLDVLSRQQEQHLRLQPALLHSIPLHVTYYPRRRHFPPSWSCPQARGTGQEKKAKSKKKLLHTASNCCARRETETNKYKNTEKLQRTSTVGGVYNSTSQTTHRKSSESTPRRKSTSAEGPDPTTTNPIDCQPCAYRLIFVTSSNHPPKPLRSVTARDDPRRKTNRTKREADSKSTR